MPYHHLELTLHQIISIKKIFSLIFEANMKKFILPILTIIYFFAASSLLQAQDQDNYSDRLYWSPSRKIEAKDFEIKIQDPNESSFAIFEIEYGVKGFNFLRKNFNKKIVHYMVPSHSQIVISDNYDDFLLYQQTLFDIEEIYVRKLREAVSLNRKKLIFTATIVDELKKVIIDTDLKNRQDLYTKETSSGRNKEKQKEWEKQIQIELDELHKYAYDY